jgi:hypothetical protein
LKVGKGLVKKKETDKEEVEEAKTPRKVASDPLPIIVGLIFGLGIIIFAFILIIGVQYGFIVL